MSPARFVFWAPRHPATATHSLLAEFTAATMAANAFGTATMGSANDTSSSTADVVYISSDPADGN